ncbi:MAG: GTP-binding protein [Methanomassiliicoccales archaeon]|nr:MAG: GTP-binding protein [Methanomassiliicoccales archaeon]
MSEVKEMIKKICVIGEAAVGKTSLIRRFVLDKFDDRYFSTIGTKTSAKELQVELGDEVTYLKLQIWDILGLRSFSKIQKNAYKGAHGAFIVMDITRKGTLRTLDSWLLALYKVAGEIPVVIIGNKIDLNPEFQKSELVNIVTDYGFPCYLTSAKTGENVSKSFNKLGRMIVKSWKPFTKVLPKLEKSVSPEQGIEPELALDRKLSIFEVEDIIMARYCDLLEDTDFAMAIIRNQFKRAEFNFMYPNVVGLRKAVGYLIDAASTSIEAPRLEKERKVYTNLIKMIE